MAISNTIRKGILSFKTSENEYTKFLPKTLANLVTTTSGTDVESKINELDETVSALQGKIADEATERKVTDSAEESARKQADAAEKAERQAEIAVERARIDKLTKMEEGSTTGDAELLDIRVGADGVTYDSAGEAVRSQIGKVTQTLKTLESIPEEYADLDAEVKSLKQDLFGGNKYIEYPTEDGYYKNAEFGEGTIATYQKASIDVSDMVGVELTIVSTSVDTFIYNGFVDENGTRIGTAWNGAGIFVKTVPNDAKYLKICYLVSTGKTTISYESKGILEDVAKIDEKIKENNEEIYEKIFSSNTIQLNNSLFVSMATDTFWACNSFLKNIIKTTVSETKFDEEGSGQYEGVTSWQNNAWFKVNGNAGDDFVTFSEAGNADMTDVQTDDEWHGCVLQDSNGNFHNCLAKRKDETSLYIYPTLTEDLNNVEMGNVMADSLHLTRRGFYAYAYGLHNINPKH